MRKKFTMLLASLFLVMGTAWALPTEGQLYRIKNVVTGYYLDITSTEVNGIKNKTLDLLDVNQCFYFIPSETDGMHYIKSANNQYVARSGQSLWDMRATDVVPSGTSNNGHITLVSVTGTEDQYYLQTTSTASWGNNMAPNNGDDAEGASIYSDKSQSANYPKWQVIAVTEAELTELIANAKDVTLAAAITEANEWLSKDKVATSDAGTALSSAVSAAQNLSATAKIEEITAAITAVQTATSAAEKYYNTIADLADLADNEYYKLYGQRGFIYAADGVLKGTNAVNAAYDANNMNQHFAIIKKNDKYYLYNVGAKKFVVKSGNNTTLVDLPEQPITLESTDNADYAWSIKLNGTNKINLSSGWNSYGIYTDYNDTDEGNRWAICRVGTFDNSEALAAFDKVYVTVNYVLGSKKTVTQKNAIAKGETFSFSNPYVYTSVTSCTKGGETLTANNGTYSFEVTEATTVTVNLEEQLPFTLSEDYENAVWYRLKIRPDAVKWVVREDEKPYDNVTTRPADDNGLWAFVGNAIDGVQVLNKAAGAEQTLSLDNTNNQTPVYMKSGTASWTLGKCVKNGHEGFLLRYGTTGNKYVHDFGGQLKLWDSSSAPTDLGSAFIAEAPLSITYLYKGEELTDYKVDTYVNYGTVYTITNPYANKYVNVTCAVNGNRVEAVDGQWSVNVTEATNVIVTITEDLPFKVSTDFANANWQYLQMNSNNWKYMQTKEADNKTTSVNVNSLGDRALWAFVGDALNGFKIWNKGAGEGYVLTVDAVTDKTEAYMKENGTQVWTIEKGNGGFIIRQGTQECLNDYAGGNVMKIWNNTGAPNGTGSAFRTISVGVTDLADLCFPGIFTLQAERSPLLYDANAGEPTKLSSGMVSSIPANAKDTKQQFLISESDTDGLYYLYNIAAARFVDADLNFTDYPEPVLSFEANPANPVFPWFVKIGGKYVVPGENGEVNKIFHTSTPADDDGKRYRIEKADEDLDLAMSVAYVIGYAEGLLKDVNSLDNSKVYLVSTYDRGAWMYNDDEDALWSTRVADPNSEDPNNPNWLPGGANPEDKAQQFAFLTVGGKIYLYSVGAGKFVVKSGDHTAYSDDPTQPVVLLPAAGYKFFPIVVAFVDGENQHHIGISNGFTPPVITNYNNLADSGNKVDIREVGDLENSAEILAEMETYLTAQTLVPELQALIAKAELALTYLLEVDKAALATAKTAAENVLASGSYTAETLGEQITALTTALNNATLVSETTGFNNAYVYTFVSQRGWMVATEEDATVKSANEEAADNAFHQWAVYKSVNNKYYLYNIGKQQFMGFVNTGGAQIPFAATPQMTTLTFKKSNWEDYPIMFSVDDLGAVNNDWNGNMIYWADGWTNLEDGGNNHKVTIVGTVPSATLTAIESRVVFFEATHALDVAIAAVQAKVDVMDKLGYYSSSNENIEADFNAIKDFKAAINAETAVDAINAQTTAANNLVATFTVLNVPQAGKFYRLKGKASGKYMSTPLSTDAANRVKMRLSENPDDAGCIFYLTDNNKLLSYKLGTFLCNTHDINAIGESNGNAVNFNKSESDNIGFFTLKTDYSGSKYIYDDKNDTEVDRNGSYAANNCEWSVEEVSILPVTVTATGYATLYAPVALEIPDGVTAYVGVKEDNYLDLTDIEEVTGGSNVIPANTGVILEAAPDTYDFVIAGDVPALEASKNLLTGKYPKSEKNADAKVYTLQNGTNGVGFYLFKGQNAQGTKTYINGFRAWVELPAEQSAPALAFRFRGNGTTDIENSEFAIQNSAIIYDLTGRRIEKIVEKGIYIVNGKKVIVK